MTLTAAQQDQVVRQLNLAKALSAKEARGRREQFDEILSDAHLALCTAAAAHRNDGAPFEPYAVLCMKWAFTSRRRVGRLLGFRRDEAKVAGMPRVQSGLSEAFRAEDFRRNHNQDSDNADLFRVALGCLTEGERDVIKALFWGDQSYSEVARELGIGITTVFARKHSALRKLRRFMRKRRIT